jgi:energy-converting hydrogenase A subunit M
MDKQMYTSVVSIQKIILLQNIKDHHDIVKNMKNSLKVTVEEIFGKD